MKYLEKFILILFSVIIIVVSVAIILSSTEMINISNLFSNIQSWLISNKIISIVVGAIFAILALIGMFSQSSESEDVKTGLAIKGDKGTVYITKDTFDSIIFGVTRNYAELKNVRVETNLSDDGVIANIYAMILPDTVVPTLTAKLQENVKSSVLKQTTVEIKEANIKIKGVYVEPQKK